MQATKWTKRKGNVSIKKKQDIYTTQNLNSLEQNIPHIRKSSKNKNMNKSASGQMKPRQFSVVFRQLWDH